MNLKSARDWPKILEIPKITVLLDDFILFCRNMMLPLELVSRVHLISKGCANIGNQKGTGA